MRRRFVILFCFLAAVILSCTYSPDGIYLSPIKPVVPSARIFLNNQDTNDTIRIDQATNFSFLISSQKVTVSKVSVLLDKTTLEEFNNTSGSFSIYGANLTTGIFTLKIQFTSNSGTGSLADKVGIETVTLWKSWILVIDVDPPVKPVLTKTIENGFLKISWTPYTKNNFLSYVIQKYNYYETRIVSITDPQKTFFIDSSYVGSNGYATNYYVTIYARNGSTISDPKIVDEPQALAMVYSVVDSTAQLSWRSTKYISAFKDVEIFENGVSRKIVLSPNDTTQAVRLESVLFGQPSQIGIVVHGKYPPKLNYQPFTKNLTIDNPTGAIQVPTYQMFMYGKSLDQVISLDFLNARINFYNHAMELVNSLTQSMGSVSVPYPGNYLYTNNAGLVQINLVSKSSSTVLTKGRWGGFFNPLIVSGSDNQLISYGVLDNSSFPDNEYTTTLTNMSQSNVYDYTDSYTPYIPNYQYNYGIPILSDDGRYVQKGTNIYKITGDSLSLLGKLSNASFVFRPDNTGEMISNAVPTTIIKTADQSILRSFSPPGYGYIQKNYDAATKQILYEAEYGTVVYLINIDTQKTTTIQAYSTGWIFLNGWLINQRSGYAKKIQ